MKTLGNLLWILCGGLVSALSWAFAGLFWCITVVGLPLGKQCFKLAKLTLAPFGKEIKDEGSAVSTVANIFWIIFTGLPMAIENAVLGIVLCVTIIGIPFGKQYFKLARLSLAPFGKSVD